MRYRQQGALKIPLVPIHALAFFRAFRVFRGQETLPLLSVFSATSVVISSSLRREKARRVLTTENTEGTEEIIRGRRNINVSSLLPHKLAKRRRLACEVALYAAASVFDQEVHLFRRLNAFGDRFQFEPGGDVKRQTHDLA